MKSLIEAIEKREDVSPKEGTSKYGSVTFADAKNRKYPIDSEAHVRAAWSYINMPKNAGKYSSSDVATIKGRIKAAGKKYGIDFSDDDGDKKDKAESSLVYAAATVDLEGQTPAEIVYLPRGEMTIRPRVAGKAKEVTVKVDAAVAETLQADLTKRLADPIRPYAGFDHQPGAASFLPKAFKWDEDKGVVLEVDWTQRGRDDVAGRNWSYFSPTFMLDGKNVAGLPKTGEVGSLVNDPAFRIKTMKIAAAAADNDDDDEGTQECPKCGHKFKSKKTESMDATTQKLVELEVITAEQAAEADEAFIIRAIDGLHGNLAMVQAANAKLMTENTALLAKVQDVQKAEATSIVEAAIAEGKIGAKDQSSIDFWTAQLTNQPTTAKKVLASLPANPLLQRVIDVKVKDGKRTTAGQSEADLVQAQHLAVSEIRAANPAMSFADAFNKAKRDKPEVFPVEA
jgi:phage I-like protein